MKPQLIEVIRPANESFAARMGIIPFDDPWHFHSEIEILYYLDARGVDFIGDSMVDMLDGRLMLLGENLPHASRLDKNYYKINDTKLAKVIVIHFKKDFLGTELWNAPEFYRIAELLIKSKRGIIFNQKAGQGLAPRLLNILNLEGIERTLELISILDVMSKNKGKYITSISFVNEYDEKDSRITSIYEYTFKNFSRNFNLKTIASEVNLTPTSFCRFFKTKTRKNYSDFLAEVRIGYACKLLVAGDLNISQISYETGHKSISNFNRHFKKVTNMSPSQYMKKFSHTSHK